MKTTYKIVDGIKIQDIQVFLNIPRPNPAYSGNPKIVASIDNSAFSVPTYSYGWDAASCKYGSFPWAGITLDNHVFNTTIELDAGAIHRGYVTVGCIDLATGFYYYLGLQDLMSAIKEYGVVDNKITGRFYFRRGGKVYLTPVVKD